MRSFDTNKNKINTVRVVIKEKMQEAMSQTATQKASTSRAASPTTPKMGGLIETQDGKEAWTGGKPDMTWTVLDVAASREFQLQLRFVQKKSKAAMAMINALKDCTLKKATKFKHNGDLNFFCKMFKKHLQKMNLTL